MRKALEGKGLPLGETRLIRLDGRVIPVEAVGNVVYYEGKRAMQIIIRDITERKRAEETLRQGDAKLHMLWESGVIGIAYSNAAGDFTGANDAFLQMVGYTREDLEAGRLRWTDMTPPEWLPRDRAAQAEADIRRICTPYEKEYIRKDGSRVPILIGFSRLEGSETESIAFVLDITERKRTEVHIAKLTCLYAALSRVNETTIRVRDAESLYHEVCRIVSEECNVPLVWIGQVQERQVVPVAWYGSASDYLKEIKVEIDGKLGQGPTGTSIREKRAVINDDFATNPNTSPWREPARNYGFRASAAFPLRLRGRVIGALTLYSPDPGTFDVDQVTLLESLSADISYAIDAIDQEQLRVRAEDALRESEQRLYEIIEFAPDATFAIDKERKVIAWNMALEEMTGVQASAILGKGNYEYAVPFYGERRPVLIDLAFSSEEEIKKKYQFVKKEEGVLIAETDATLRGSKRVLWVKASLLHDDKGNISGAIESIRDITERKQVEEELKKRTAQLEELNKELESFSYSVSHDLRAPLRAIDGYARMILKKQKDKFDEDTLGKFNVIRSSTKMMGQLIDDLLAFSRLGRKQMSLVLLDMNALIRDAWKELELINPERNIRLTVKKVPAGYGDRALIKQVWINLLSNAVKFTKYRDDAHIEVGGHKGENENVYFVKDNGAGFDMTYYDKLFGVFQRLHSAEVFEGTGVGLATIQRVIQRHGGRVWAEGKVDEGACFYFSLSTKQEQD